ncbi:hypothetical protein Tco_0953755 [Tanacetum coccineum]|uniref:Integrase, catalytic region, zinc finger, CCHC-type, peptidase aspartic, catalytic n=1 Tax=Tanacetum coccineum TaxID=301880 RepID=A0ABQ5E0V5_9ASTR
MTKQERASMLYDEFDKFTSEPGESIHSYYLRYAKLINDMNMIPMHMSNMQINTKCVNHLQPEWSRFIIAAKQARDLHVQTFKWPVTEIRIVQGKTILRYAAMLERLKLHEVKDSEWFKDKMLLAQSQEAGVMLHEEQQDFLADRLEENDDSTYMVTIQDEVDHYVPPPIQNKDMTLSVNDHMKSQVDHCNMSSTQEERDLLGKFDDCIKRRTTLSPRDIDSWEQSDIKGAFTKDVIPFFKNLKETFKLFEKGLNDEIWLPTALLLFFYLLFNAACKFNHDVVGGDTKRCIMPSSRDVVHHDIAHYIPMYLRTRGFTGHEREIYKSLVNRLFHEGRSYLHDFLRNDTKIFATLSTGGAIGFDCLLDINEQIFPIFVLQFYKSVWLIRNLNGTLCIGFVIDNVETVLTLENFGRILRIPYEGVCLYSSEWSISSLQRSCDPHPNLYPPPHEDPSLVCDALFHPRTEPKTRTIKSDSVTLEPFQMINNELRENFKKWEIILSDNAISLTGHKDHPNVSLCYMLYCLANGKPFNLAYFIAHRMVSRCCPLTNRCHLWTAPATLKCPNSILFHITTKSSLSTLSSAVLSSASSDVTHTSVYTDSEPAKAFWGSDDEEISDGGIPRVIILGYDGTPDSGVAPPSPIYIP